MFSVGVLFFLNRDYVMTLFTDPRGHIMLGVAVGFLVAGTLVMGKMIRFDI